MDRAEFEGLLRRRSRWQAVDAVRLLASVLRRQTYFYRQIVCLWRRLILKWIAKRHEKKLREAEERDRRASLRRRQYALRNRLLPRGAAGAVYWRSEWRAIRAAFAAFRAAACFAAERRAWERWCLGDD